MGSFDGSYVLELDYSPCVLLWHTDNWPHLATVGESPQVMQVDQGSRHLKEG